MSTTTSTRTGTEEKALKLLGDGYGPKIVASACGVSESRISQLLSDPTFTAQVADLRFENLQQHSELDNVYDRMESKLAHVLEELIPLMMKPAEVINAITRLNALKRKSAFVPEHVTQQNQVVNLVMPTQIISKFTVNINNQVVHAGGQTLETVQANTLMENSKKDLENRIKQNMLIATNINLDGENSNDDDLKGISSTEEHS